MESDEESTQSGIDGRDDGERERNHPGSRLEEAQKQIDIARQFMEDNGLLYLRDVELLLRKGLSGTQAVDYIAVEREGIPQAEWGRRTGRSRTSVYSNVKKAKEALDHGTD